MSANPATSNETFVLGLGINGTVQPLCKVIQKVNTTADVQAFSFHCMVSLQQNDRIRVFVGNLSSTADINIQTLNIFAMGM